jgi:hypothetical protein
MSMMTVKIKKDLSRLDTLDKTFPSAVDKSTHDVAMAIADRIHGGWSENSPASPDTPPAVVTGNLDRSVIVERQGRALGGQFSSGNNTSMWLLTIGAPYAGILEHGSVAMLPHPFVLPAVLDIQDDLPDYYKEIFNILW